jgi:hypothetical protein
VKRNNVNKRIRCKAKRHGCTTKNKIKQSSRGLGEAKTGFGAGKEAFSRYSLGEKKEKSLLCYILLLL